MLPLVAVDNNSFHKQSPAMESPWGAVVRWRFHDSDLIAPVFLLYSRRRGLRRQLPRGLGLRMMRAA